MEGSSALLHDFCDVSKILTNLYLKLVGTPGSIHTWMVSLPCGRVCVALDLFPVGRICRSHGNHRKRLGDCELANALSNIGHWQTHDDRCDTYEQHPKSNTNGILISFTYKEIIVTLAWTSRSCWFLAFWVENFFWQSEQENDPTTPALIRVGGGCCWWKTCSTCAAAVVPISDKPVALWWSKA